MALTGPCQFDHMKPEVCVMLLLLDECMKRTVFEIPSLLTSVALVLDTDSAAESS